MGTIAAMEINYLGVSCVRLRGRDTQVIVDPTPQVEAAMAKAPTDIVVRTDRIGKTETLHPAEGRAQEISGPGEYEVRGVAISGLPSGQPTIMRVEVDDVRVVAVGALSRQLTEEEIDSLGHVDVLILPVGGGDGLDAASATKLTRAVEPAIVIPVRYSASAADGGYAGVDAFAREMGITGDVVSVPKLNLNGSMTNVDETRVVVLEPRT